MAYTDVLNMTSKIGGITSNVLSTATSLFGTDEGSSSSIRDRYLNGFMGDTNMFTPSVFARIFDEPTYLTFRIEFDFSNDKIENKTNAGYNYMPEPLLALPVSETDTSSTFTGGYSTYEYLKNALGEEKRAKLHWLFVNALKDIQTNYPYYFTQISGISDMLTVMPGHGKRIKDESRLKISCMEGLDLKITQLMQLYRKIAWDDVYQRWILPDMMRYFTMKIYISEMRLFHSPSKSNIKTKESNMYDLSASMNATSIDKMKSSINVLNTINTILDTASAISTRMLGTNSAVTNVVNQINQTTDTVIGLISDIAGDYFRLCNNAINDVMPTICIECHMCEFDLEDTSSHLNELYSSNQNNQLTPSISIKVGDIKEIHAYPLNAGLTPTEHKYRYLNDIKETNNVLAKSSYLSDEELMGKEIDDNITEYTEDTSITKTIKRINPSVDAQRNDNLDLQYRIAHADAALAGVGALQEILNQFSAEEAYSAATTLREIRNFISNSDIIKSAATNYEERPDLEASILVNIFDRISRWEATNKDNITNPFDSNNADYDITGTFFNGLDENGSLIFQEHSTATDSSRDAVKELASFIVNRVAPSQATTRNEIIKKAGL